MANDRLTRDKDHAMLGGVCAGIANRFDLDPTIVRAVTIALGVVTAGTTLIIYLALWVIVPAAEVAPHRPTRDEITEELRDAADRVQEAAKIATAAARQAADEIARIQGRRRTTEGDAPDVAPPGTSELASAGSSDASTAAAPATPPPPWGTQTGESDPPPPPTQPAPPPQP